MSVYEVVKTVKFERGRWNVRIELDTGLDTGPLVFVASADEGLTHGDGIYFKTLAEFEADCERAF